MFQIIILVCSVGAITCTDDNSTRIVYPELVPICSLMVSEEYLAHISELLPEGSQARFTCVRRERS